MEERNEAAGAAEFNKTLLISLDIIVSIKFP